MSVQEGSPRRQVPDGHPFAYMREKPDAEIEKKAPPTFHERLKAIHGGSSTAGKLTGRIKEVLGR